MMTKKIVLGMTMLLSSMAFVGCVSDVSDSNYTHDKLNADYTQKFEQTFGKIAVGNDWGFGAAASMRASATTGFDQYDVSGLHKPINGKKKVDAFIDDFNKAKVVTNVDFSDYFLQHVIKQTNKGNKGWGTKDQHHQMAQLQAYNYNTGEWEDVENFVGGKSEKQFINGNNETHGTTLKIGRAHV